MLFQAGAATSNGRNEVGGNQAWELQIQDIARKDPLS